MKFTVDRSKWKNAKHGKGYSKLLNSEGFRCCLGFCESQLGIDDKQLFGTSTPSGLSVLNIFSQSHQFYGTECSRLSRRAMSINDNCAYSDAERESKLQAAFIEAGHEIEFIGEFQD